VARGNKERDPYLGINVQYAAFALIGDASYGSETSSVQVSRELDVLDESDVIDHSAEGILGDKVVVNAIGLAGTGETSGIWLYIREGKTGSGKEVEYGRR